MGDFVPQGFAHHPAQRQSAQPGFPLDRLPVENDPVRSRFGQIVNPLGQGRAAVETEQLGRIVQSDLGEGGGIGPILDQHDKIVQPLGIFRGQGGQDLRDQLFECVALQGRFPAGRQEAPASRADRGNKNS